MGMRVLDLGSGTGDVAFVAAELVGPAGEVVGIDSSPEAVATAQARAQQRGLGNVRFVMGDIHEPAPGGPFDVIVGRLVLMYVPDPPVVLRTQAALLRPGPDPQDADAGDPHRLASRRNAQQLPSVGARIATAHPRPCRPRRPDPRW
ncbi:MAG TPA: class I SAM-dependent methyltransferase [Actinomycetes bacterium]|nr:class I SAM-dependent methyltransferase [Actinomycetes bacterium]